MRKKGVKDDAATQYTGNLFGALETQTKQLREKVDQLQRQIKDSRTNSDVARCNAANVQKAIQAESKLEMF